MPMTPINRRCLVITLTGTLFCASAWADRQGDARDHDHDHARHALERGEVRPITEILARVATEVPGEVVGVEFERERRHGEPCWIYELKILAEDGRLLEVLVDAATGRILEMEED